MPPARQNATCSLTSGDLNRSARPAQPGQPLGVDGLGAAERERDAVRDDRQPALVQRREGRRDAARVDVLRDDLNPLDAGQPRHRQVDLRPPADPYAQPGVRGGAAGADWQAVMPPCHPPHPPPPPPPDDRSPASSAVRRAGSCMAPSPASAMPRSATSPPAAVGPGSDTVRRANAGLATVASPADKVLPRRKPCRRARRAFRSACCDRPTRTSPPERTAASAARCAASWSSTRFATSRCPSRSRRTAPALVPVHWDDDVVVVRGGGRSA